MMHERIIFLDIDGVLNNLAAFAPGKPGGSKRFAPECVAAANYIINATGAKIVVSSTWRFDPDIAQVLKAAGLSGEVVGITPCLRDDQESGPIIALPIPRGREILHWLQLHQARSFVILDDDDDMDTLGWALVRTDFESGLTMYLAKRAVRMLLGLSE